MDIDTKRIPFLLEGKKVLVCSFGDMVRSSLTAKLEEMGCTVIDAGRKNLDLANQDDVFAFFKKHSPDAVFALETKFGGKYASQTMPAELLYRNLMMAGNVIEAAYNAEVQKLLFMGYTSVYPKDAEQPMREDSLLTGPFESVNEPYAVASLCGLKLCQFYRKQFGCDFISVMATNVFGPQDNFDLTYGGVIPSLIHRAYEAKMTNKQELEVWGSGTPRREFIYADDLADALIFLMERYSDSLPLNVGTGEGATIAEIVEKIKDVVGFDGTVNYDTSKPDGMPVKVSDISKIKALGWEPKISLLEGIRKTYDWFGKNYESIASQTQGVPE
ncbi:MAG: GDP-L-fucose synthase [Alphaproteobacteria bacterium]|nr:GDP-L-fucose synthase [Alphaproteobacteria bacterium]